MCGGDHTVNNVQSQAAAPSNCTGLRRVPVFLVGSQCAPQTEASCTLCAHEGHNRSTAEQHRNGHAAHTVWPALRKLPVCRDTIMSDSAGSVAFYGRVHTGSDIHRLFARSPGVALSLGRSTGRLVPGRNARRVLWAPASGSHGVHRAAPREARSI